MSNHVASKLSRCLPELDHRLIGLKQNLFFFNEASQGSCFFEPRGARIYNKLIDYLRLEYKKHNYDEVVTPNIYNCHLWEKSGHWEHYEKNIIKFKLSDKDYSLKPMNCPGHCLMFKHQKVKTNNQLPVRWADFGVLHRNELSGSLIGLTRVRRFQQDDAHIFCTPNQVEEEVSDCLQFANQVYKKFNFTFDLKLSLRPEAYLGTEELWNQAEDALRLALKNNNLNYEEQKFEGAFYGPKIDMVVKDCLQRTHQCATIQLDFQLPERFELTYRNDEDKSLCRPVIIHRAILGSLERFIAMIAENCAGRWPFWLSPLQAIVVPVHTSFNDYAKSVHEELREQGFWVDCDLSKDETLNAKIRKALLTPYNLVLIVGNHEAKTSSVNVRIPCNPMLTDTSAADLLLSNNGGISRDSSVNGADPPKDLQHFSRQEVDAASDTVGSGDCGDGGQLIRTSDKKLTRTSSTRRKSVHNINISIGELVDRFNEFEQHQVDRADLELLELAGIANKG